MTKYITAVQAAYEDSAQRIRFLGVFTAVQAAYEFLGIA